MEAAEAVDLHVDPDRCVALPWSDDVLAHP
jgi:hypothetical protein